MDGIYYRIGKSSKELDLTYDAALDNILRLDTLSENHPAVLYLKSRKIPQNLWHLFYFAPKFMAWTNTLVPGKFEIRDKDYPRLIIPSFNEHGKMFGYAGRAFGDETPKYFNVKLDEDEEKVYGRERLDYSQPIYVVEGQVDSMLIDNAIAVAGSSFDTPYVQGIKTNCTLVPDCEPRNPQIVAQYRKYIAAGYKVCMLPESFVYKDINEAVIGNMTPKEIIDLINANSYQGLSAEIKFASWSKCSEPKRPVLVQNNTNRINTLGSIKLNF